jgi:ABC-type transport system involved in multi-copper enzyme maturation permease subunit
MAVNELRAVDKCLGIVSVVLLAAYFVLVVYALSSPSDDPQRGMAVGFVILAGLVLLSLGGVRTVSVLVILPALSMIAQEIFLLLHRGR